MARPKTPKGRCPNHHDRAVVPGRVVCAECHERWMANQLGRQAPENHNEVDRYLQHVVEQESLPAYLRTQYEGVR
jgi:hypothetical protein